MLVPRLQTYFEKCVNSSESPSKRARRLLNCMLSILNILYCAKFLPDKLLDMVSENMDEITIGADGLLSDPSMASTRVPLCQEILNNVNSIRTRDNSEGKVQALACHDKIQEFEAVMTKHGRA